MTITLILIALAAALSTMLGGLFALRFKDRTHLIIGFSAGAVIGVALFDLLPEAIELISETAIEKIMLFVTLGFVAYMIIDRFFSTPRGSAEFLSDDHTHSHSLKRGNLKAGSFSVHSLLDGVGIGLAFQVSVSLGAIVALAVLTHDFSDGINTVSAVLKSKGDRKMALKWLFADAVAPVIGIFLTLFFSVSPSTLQIVLAFFAGSFLYIGASDLIPESFHAHPTKWTTIATLFGIAVLYAAIHLAG